MKRILLFALVLMLGCTALAEAPSAADEFLTNLGATWDSLVRMGSEAVSGASDWLANEFPAWAQSTGEALSGWLEGAGAWTEEAASNLQRFVEQNGPAVEAWLNQAGQDVRDAWETLANPGAHTAREVETAYEVVAADLEQQSDTAPAVGPTLGDWTVVDHEPGELPEDARRAFDKAVKGREDARFVPVTLLSVQVVSGTNYCILCELKGDAPAWALVYVYADLQGNAEITNVYELYVDRHSAPEE